MVLEVVVFKIVKSRKSLETIKKNSDVNDKSSFNDLQ